MRRAACGLTVLLCLMALVLACPALSGCADETDRPGAGTPEAIDAGGRAATLVKVVDGDTIWVRLDDGAEEKVRYIGLDAPEAAQDGRPGEPLAEEATRYNALLLSEGPLRLVTDAEERDQHGRLLAYVWAGDVFVNEQLILGGFARAHAYPPNLAMQERLGEAERTARSAGVGLWAAD